jgi:hypothetical protein
VSRDSVQFYEALLGESDDWMLRVIVLLHAEAFAAHLDRDVGEFAFQALAFLLMIIGCLGGPVREIRGE